MSDNSYRVGSVVGAHDHESKPSFFFSVRFLLSFVIFLGVGIQYMQKIDMGIAIVCMVNNTALHKQPVSSAHSRHMSTVDDYSDASWLAPLLATGNDNHTTNTTCKFTPKQANKTDGPFAWDKSTQGLVLSSYFYGYLITQIPSGWLSYKFGGRTMLGLSMLIGSIGTMLCAPSANIGYGVLIVCRFLTGLAHGAVWPAISQMWVNWAPSPEKSRLIGFAGSGTNIGNVIALPLGGFLCANGFDGGWPSIFYTFGLIGVAWFGLLMLLTNESPRNHFFISDREKSYILANTNPDGGSRSTLNDQKSLIASKKKRPSQSTPWKKIFTSKACLALFVSHFCSNWGNYLFLTQLPTYMKEILQFDIKSNGLFSSIPYVNSWLCAILSSLISDKLITSNTLTRTNTRKLFNGLGLFIPMLSMICLSFVTCADPYIGVGLLTIGVGLFGASWAAGFVVNLNEVAGRYTSVVFGISNTFGTLPGIIAPYVVSVLTVNQQQDEWRIVFWMSAGVFLVGGIVYSCFASGEVQQWAIDAAVAEDAADEE